MIKSFSNLVEIRPSVVQTFPLPCMAIADYYNSQRDLGKFADNETILPFNHSVALKASSVFQYLTNLNVMGRELIFVDLVFLLEIFGPDR